MRTRWMTTGLIALGFSLPAHAWTLRATNLGGWAQTSPLEVQYNLSGCSRSDAEILALIDSSINIWNNSQNSGMRLTRASSPVTATPADVVALTATPTPVFVCDTNFSAVQGADGDVIPALARLGTVGSRIGYAGVVINSEAGKAANIGTISYQSALVAIAHELGHALGLGHSSDNKALMYYSIGGKTDAVLTQDDMDGIAFLYPRNELSGGMYGCAAVHAPNGSATRAPAYLWIAVILLGLVVGRGLRRAQI